MNIVLNEAKPKLVIITPESKSNQIFIALLSTVQKQPNVNNKDALVLYKAF